mgnify:FL=1
MEIPRNEPDRLATPQEREELNRLLGSYGLVDATLFDMPEDTQYDDEKWIIRGKN